MADISTISAATVRRFSFLRLSFPRLAIGVSLSAAFGLVSDAYKMACVDPYNSRRRQPQITPDAVLEGRDPAW